MNAVRSSLRRNRNGPLTVLSANASSRVGCDNEAGTMSYGTFTVVAGPFSTAPDAHSVTTGRLRLRAANDRRMWLGMLHVPQFEALPPAAITSVEVAHEESAKNFVGSAAAGLAGALLLGPVGAVAGALSGGNHNLVTFVLTLADGRRALCTAKAHSFRLLQAAAFQAANPTPEEAPAPIGIKLARLAILAAVVGGLSYGAWWATSAPFRDADQAHFEAQLTQMRTNFPNLSEAQLRQRVEEWRK